MLSEKQKIITEMEYKRKELGTKMKNHINTIKLNPNQFIYAKTHCERLFN